MPDATAAGSPQRLVLLPGWALGPEPLRPLAEAIEQCSDAISVSCYRYPPLTSQRLDIWLEALDEEIEAGCWLGGWSLGGMLATALAEHRGSGARGLVTLASNACFVTRADWSTAMAGDTLSAFGNGLRHRPLDTVRRFALLCARGGHDTRRLGQRLLMALPQLPPEQAAAGLALLRTLDLRRALGRLAVPQLHLFGEQDVLVPAAARQAIAELLPPTGITRLIADSGHGFVLEKTEQSAALIAAFITAGGRLE
ncbi:alpha/beta fold hydrolase [Kushneria aurantia]|uniref:Alpha/beta fold hydrolase n=1 Tax=Kushneria aurantia TaxID=504092 RepID=A0ABV6FYQ6_9GAMM|nr:alpha/beta fold hydrolase [Kushneria aurantia]